MDTISSRSTTHTLELPPATPVTRMAPLISGQGIYLIATCLLNAPTSRMSVCEMFEWLAVNYARYQYTKVKIRTVLRHDRERNHPRFMIANKNRAPGVPPRWTIRPGIEPELRRRFGCRPPGPESQLLRSFSDDLPQPFQCDNGNRGVDNHEGFMRHQRDVHGNWSPAVHGETGSVANYSAALYEPATGSKRLAGESSRVDQASCKRPRISDPASSTRTQLASSTTVENPPLAIEKDILERHVVEAEEARELERLEVSGTTDMQEETTMATIPSPSNRGYPTSDHQTSQHELSEPVGTAEAAIMAACRDGNVVGQNSSASIRENAVIQQKLHSRGGPTIDTSKYYKLYTKAAILSPRRTVELDRVKIDGSSEHNLLPSSIASKLRLSSYFGDKLRIRLANRSIPANRFCRLSIGVAGLESTIDTCVVTGLSSLLLGIKWIRHVNLLSDFENHTYYIPGLHGNLIKVPDPKAAVAAEDATESAAGEDLATGEGVAAGEQTPTIDEVATAPEEDEGRRIGELARVDKTNETSDDGRVDVASRQRSDEDSCHIVNRILAEKREDGMTYFLVHWDGYSEDESTWEPPQNILDKRLLGTWRRRKIQEYLGIQPVFDLMKFEERRRKRTAEGKHRRRSKPKIKRVGTPELFFGSDDVDDFFQARNSRDTNRSITGRVETQLNGVETLISKQQGREIIKILKYVKWTQAGANFKKPTADLWPEDAEVYATRIPHPIDLWTIEMKVKKDMYRSLNDFKADVCLLYQNTVDYNGINHIITSAALEVRDEILTVTSDLECGKHWTGSRASARLRERKGTSLRG